MVAVNTIDPEHGKAILVNAKVTRKLIADLDAIAAAEGGTNRSAVIRRLLAEGVEREQQRRLTA